MVKVLFQLSSVCDTLRTDAPPASAHRPNKPVRMPVGQLPNRGQDDVPHPVWERGMGAEGGGEGSPDAAPQLIKVTMSSVGYVGE